MRHGSRGERALLRLNKPESATLRLKRRDLRTRKLWLAEDLPSDFADALGTQDLDEIVASGDPLQVKDRCIVVRLDRGGQTYLMKRHIWGGVQRTTRMLLRESASRRCAQLALQLAKLGIPTPRPLACIERGLGPFSDRSYLVTEFIQGSSLWQLVRSGALAPSDLTHLANQVANIWQRLIDASLSHNDLKPENLLVDNSLNMWLIDLEKLKTCSSKRKLHRDHLQDAERFLHVRNWRHQPDAAEYFRQALRQTSLAALLEDSGRDRHLLLKAAYSDQELAAGISVAIVIDESRADDRLLQKSAASVKDLADEIAVVAPFAANGRFEVRETVAANHTEGDTTAGPRVFHPEQSQQRRLQQPWVLVLVEGECATPDLVRQLPEKVVNSPECDAIRIPIDEFAFGRPTQRRNRGESPPVRMFRQDCCGFSLIDGKLTVNVHESRIGHARPVIRRYVSTGLHDLVAQLNSRSTRQAMELYDRGRRSSLPRAVFATAARFLNEYLWRGAYRSGRLGVQVASIEAMFTWLQESKLRQYHNCRRALHEPVDTPDGVIAGSIVHVAAPKLPQQASARRKAA